MNQRAKERITGVLPVVALAGQQELQPQAIHAKFSLPLHQMLRTNLSASMNIVMMPKSDGDRGASGVHDSNHRLIQDYSQQVRENYWRHAREDTYDKQKKAWVGNMVGKKNKRGYIADVFESRLAGDGNREKRILAQHVFEALGIHWQAGTHSNTLRADWGKFIDRFGGENGILNFTQALFDYFSDRERVLRALDLVSEIELDTCWGNEVVSKAVSAINEVEILAGVENVIYPSVKPEIVPEEQDIFAIFTDIKSLQFIDQQQDNPVAQSPSWSGNAEELVDSGVLKSFTTDPGITSYGKTTGNSVPHNSPAAQDDIADRETAPMRVIAKTTPKPLPPSRVVKGITPDWLLRQPGEEPLYERLPESGYGTEGLWADDEEDMQINSQRVLRRGR